jgi:hypothetical protein
MMGTKGAVQVGPNIHQEMQEVQGEGEGAHYSLPEHQGNLETMKLFQGMQVR